MIKSKTISQAIIDYFVARYCIQAMKENGTYREQQIGLVREDISGQVGSYREGRVVIFTDDKDGTVTVETPMSIDEIERQRANRSLLTTVGTMINVPRNRIARLRI